MAFLFVGSSALTEASFPRDLAIPQLLLSNVWAIVPLVKRDPTTVLTHRGLSPHQFTPMSGAQSGRRGDFSPRLPHHRTCGSAYGDSWQSTWTKQHSFSAMMIAAQCSANRLHRTGNQTTDGRVLPAKFSPSRVVRPSGVTRLVALGTTASADSCAPTTTLSDRRARRHRRAGKHRSP